MGKKVGTLYSLAQPKLNAFQRVDNISVNVKSHENDWIQKSHWFPLLPRNQCPFSPKELFDPPIENYGLGVLPLFLMWFAYALFLCLLDVTQYLTQLICVFLCYGIALGAVPEVVNMNHTILSLLNLSLSCEKSILISNVRTNILLGTIAVNNRCNNLFIN